MKRLAATICLTIAVLLGSVGAGYALPSPKSRSISKSKLGKMISGGTYYLSCWMTMAQIEKARSRKVIFQNLD